MSDDVIFLLLDSLVAKYNIKLISKFLTLIDKRCETGESKMKTNFYKNIQNLFDKLIFSVTNIT